MMLLSLKLRENVGCCRTAAAAAEVSETADTAKLLLGPGGAV
jgi:hypothetical protein